MARAAGCVAGGSAGLLDLIEEHRAEFTFDFRRYFRLSLSDIGETITYGEAILLVFELRRESGSHTHMRMHGFTETMSLSQFTDMLLTQSFMNLLRGKNAQPIKLPIPWDAPDPNADVTPEQRADLEAQLERRSAFGSEHE